MGSVLLLSKSVLVLACEVVMIPFPIKSGSPRLSMLRFVLSFGGVDPFEDVGNVDPHSDSSLKPASSV